MNINKDDGVITIEGPTSEGTKVYNSVSSQLSKLSGSKAAENSLKVLEKVPEWTYEDLNNFTFVKYDEKTKYRLEMARQNHNTECVFTNSMGHECVVDFNTMTEYQKNDPSNRTKIRRKQSEGNHIFIHCVNSNT